MIVHWKIILIAAVHIAIVLSSCSVIYNVPNIDDHKIFPYREIHKNPDSTFLFHDTDSKYDYGKQVMASPNYILPRSVSLDTYLENSKTAAFLIIRNDSLIYQKYTGDYSESSLFNVFSVTKMFMSTLTGIALNEGLIQNMDQAITDFLPELSDREGFEHITIRHLLNHTSGLKYEPYEHGLFSDNARYYYTHKLRNKTLKSHTEKPPGTSTNYGSHNMQLLALVLEEASGRNLSDYLEEKLWKKTGMQYNATWSTDNNRQDAIEKAFSNFNCRAIDLAKMGRLYLNHGNWQGEQIISKEFTELVTGRDTTGGSSRNFQYSFRLGPDAYGSYYTCGLFGQYLYIYPASNIIIVRIGEADRKYNPHFLKSNILEIIDQIK